MSEKHEPARRISASKFNMKQRKNLTSGAVHLLLIVILSAASSWRPHITGESGANYLVLVEAVSVQRLNVPDLVVIDQQQQALLRPQQQQQPEAASLINQNQPHDLSGQNSSQSEAGQLQLQLQQQQQLQHHQMTTFECLIGFDKKRDKNLIIKWHHDDRIEPIYQWIPELNKRSIAPQYRAYIAPIVSPNDGAAQTNATNGLQLLEAGFRLVRPSKELGGKYTCSAISSQNDDSKWKKMIVYAPPRFFRFNATRTDISAQLANQRERLIQLTQPALSVGPQQLPPAYRMRGVTLNFDNQNGHSSPLTTISPQMYSTIDYVNVNQQRSAGPPAGSPWHLMASQQHAAGQTAQPQQQQQLRPSSKPRRHNGVKLVCDIDQVFPVPEVSIYRLAKLDGSHPDKLAKLDTKIERYATGLYHVQVISILEDEELEMKYGLNEPVYFECLIALTNLELSKYADNKRSLVYKPALLTGSQQELNNLEQTDSVQKSGASSSLNSLRPLTLIDFSYALQHLALIWFGACLCLTWTCLSLHF